LFFKKKNSKTTWFWNKKLKNKTYLWDEKKFLYFHDRN